MSPVSHLCHCRQRDQAGSVTDSGVGIIADLGPITRLRVGRIIREIQDRNGCGTGRGDLRAGSGEFLQQVLHIGAVRVQADPQPGFKTKALIRLVNVRFILCHLGMVVPAKYQHHF